MSEFENVPNAQPGMVPYSTAARDELKAVFAPVAGRHRRYMRLAAWSGVGFLGGIVLAPRFLPASLTDWILPFVLACLAGAGFALVRAARLLRCPGCAKSLTAQPAAYCPECGSPGLTVGTPLTPPHCAACGKYMRQRSRSARQYVIRACTHCGLQLDETGL